MGLTNEERIKKFLETEDWGLLEEPLRFEKAEENIGGLYWTYVVPPCVASCGLTACFAPMQCFCPASVFEQFDGVYLDQEAVWDWAALNACCFSIKKVQTAKIRLEDVQDTYWHAACCDTHEMVVKSKVTNTHSVGKGENLSIQTTHEMLRVAWLADPETAMKCINLAVKLHRKQHMAPAKEMAAAAAAMQEMARGGSGTMTERLGRLEQLKKKGVLTEEDLAGAKVAILQASPDPTVQLMEMADLYDKGMVTADELAKLKVKMLAQLAA